MEKVSNNRCAIIEFDSIRTAFRGLDKNWGERFGRIVPFCAHAAQKPEELAYGMTPRPIRAAKWASSIKERGNRSIELLSERSSDYEVLAAALRDALHGLGHFDISIPESAGRYMDRTLSYRLPNETWRTIHALDLETQKRILVELALALHDEKVRKRAKGGVSAHSAYLLLPLELAGERALRCIAPGLLRALPCLGLDWGVDDPSDYGTLFAYEDEGVFDSLSYGPLVEGLWEARNEFIDYLGLCGIVDFADFITVYGESCPLLGREASRVLANGKTAMELASQLI